MGRKLIIGFYGPTAQMDLIRAVMDQHFPEIQAIICDDENAEFAQNQTELLTQMTKQVDGIVFADEMTMVRYERVVAHQIPFLYIREDSNTLLTSLLRLSCQGIDISRLSIDNFPVTTVKSVYRNLDISTAQVTVLRRRNPAIGDPYIEELYRGHQALLRSGTVSGCITTVSSICRRLQEEGASIVCATPTTDNIITAVSHLREVCISRNHTILSSTVVLALLLKPREEFLLDTQQVYARRQEAWKAVSELYLFAEQTGAAVIQHSDYWYTIFIARDALEKYSDGLTTLYFLQIIQDSSLCDITLGIGFGISPQDARTAAETALRAANTENGNSTYIAYTSKHVIGPFSFTRTQSDDDVPNKDRLRPIVEKTGISADKLYHIHQVSVRTGKHLFTAAELSDHLKLSIRATSRILMTLQECGFATLTGRAVTGKSGRPGNIYEVRLDLD